MILFSKDQSSLFEQEQHGAFHESKLHYLSLVLDHRQWLNLLADEWWPAKAERTLLRLGTSKPISRQPQDEKIKVIAWINALLLPKILVNIRNGETWRESTVNDLSPFDTEILWPGPVPLFSIDHFTVDSEEQRSRIIGLARSFGNLAQDYATIRVDKKFIDYIDSEAPQPKQWLTPPNSWDALRGAAAMAMWSVPSMRPCLDTLCDSLNDSYDQLNIINLGAPWWLLPPWNKKNVSDKENYESTLWNSILNVLPKFPVREGWSAVNIFDQIIQHLTKNDRYLELAKDLVDETLDILSDKRNINMERGAKDPLGLALQLILLRPTPEKFTSWKDDYPEISPIVWWTGATLSGYISGFRDLEIQFRGGALARRVLAVRMWAAGSSIYPLDIWDDPISLSNVHWVSKNNVVTISCKNFVLEEKILDTRSQWYVANLEDVETRAAAISMLKEFCPSELQTTIKIKDAKLEYKGKGKFNFSPEHNLINIEGEINLLLPKFFDVNVDIDEDRFRNWLVKSYLPLKILPPAKNNKLGREILSNSAYSKKLNSLSLDPDINGLAALNNFLSYSEEEMLVASVDREKWSELLSRRVQHYGWQYDYRTSKIKPASKAAPFPAWAQKIADRLYELGLLDELPDQMIVNEYIGKQGIAPHIDSQSSFGRAIAVVSLLESWEMIFRDKRDGRKLIRTLERGGVTIFKDDARNFWTHEIPKRLKEPWGLRERRISLTFRKVILN
ncbi:alpha-ketoglutarate-dependent dioxygenase AlkB [Oxalobacteraceae sp. CFBP 13730]|nr:alpha-ketoglutarate-dependent dioxygenase AlkB [Oxalobacteraceae sp. CFBP 13730]